MQVEKYCKYCDQILPFHKFRIRVDKRKSKECEYLNNKCRDCEKIDRIDNYNQNRENPDWVKEYNRKSSEYQKSSGANKRRYEQNKDNPQWKQALKDWREKNINSVKKNQKRRSLKHHAVNRDKITDAYVFQRLKQQFPEITKEFLLENEDLIDLKRSEILNHRLKKILNDGKK